MKYLETETRKKLLIFADNFNNCVLNFFSGSWMHINLFANHKVITGVPFIFNILQFSTPASTKEFIRVWMKCVNDINDAYLTLVMTYAHNIRFTHILSLSLSLILAFFQCNNLWFFKSISEPFCIFISNVKTSRKNKS